MAALMADQNHPWLETAQWHLRDTADLLNSLEWTGKKVLDVGCWWGWFIRYAREKGAHVVGFDCEASRIRDAMSFLQGGCSLCVADALHVPFPSSTFDVAVSIHVVEHVNPERVMIKEIHRVLKPDGVLLISVPNDRSFGVLPYRPLRFLLRGKMASRLPHKLYRYVKSLCYSDLSHHREYTVQSLSRLLESNGFGVERVWRHGFDVPYPMRGRLSQRTRQRINVYFGKALPGIIRSSISIRAQKLQGEAE
jgi:ubiquinone/menaquinone biosynthesis C-methylase UbiE